MTHMTTTTHLTPRAADALIIRPSDQPALAALRQLACQNGTHVQRGAISLAGARRSAWLAFSRDGRLLVVVLLDAAENDREELSTPPPLAGEVTP